TGRARDLDAPLGAEAVGIRGADRGPHGARRVTEARQDRIEAAGLPRARLDVGDEVVALVHLDASGVLVGSVAPFRGLGVLLARRADVALPDEAAAAHFRGGLVPREEAVGARPLGVGGSIGGGDRRPGAAGRAVRPRDVGQDRVELVAEASLILGEQRAPRSTLESDAMQRAARLHLAIPGVRLA